MERFGEMSEEDRQVLHNLVSSLHLTLESFLNQIPFLHAMDISMLKWLLGDNIWTLYSLEANVLDHVLRPVMFNRPRARLHHAVMRAVQILRVHFQLIYPYWRQRLGRGSRRWYKRPGYLW